MSNSGLSLARDPEAAPSAAISMAQDPWAFGMFVLKAMLDMASGRLPDHIARPAAAGIPVTQRRAAASAGMAPFIARAMFATTASSLRTWQNLAQVHGAHQFALLHALLPVGFDSQATLKATRLQADELRGWFREIGDVSLQEARRLQMELEELGEAVAQGLEPPGQLGPHQRRWRSKS